MTIKQSEVDQVSAMIDAYHELLPAAEADDPAGYVASAKAEGLLRWLLLATQAHAMEATDFYEMESLPFIPDYGPLPEVRIANLARLTAAIIGDAKYSTFAKKCEAAVHPSDSLNHFGPVYRGADMAGILEGWLDAWGAKRRKPTGVQGIV